MYVIGVAGKQGSGKSTFATLLAKRLNCKYVDVDKISHQALYQEDIVDRLCSEFGMGILDDGGKVNRKKVGAIAFEDKEKLDVLNELAWGYMQKVLDEILSEEDEAIVLDYMLLPICGKYWDNCNAKILIATDDVVRKQKVLERDNISEEYFEKRDANGLDYSQYEFDYVLNHNYSEESMEEMLEYVSGQITDEISKL